MTSYNYSTFNASSLVFNMSLVTGLQLFCMCQHLPFRYIVDFFHKNQTIVFQLQLHGKVKQSIIEIKSTVLMLIDLESFRLRKLICDDNILILQ